MILRGLALKIGDLGLPTDFTYGFLKGSRHVCNWMEREVLRPLRFGADGFGHVVVALCTAPRAEPWINSEKVACVELPFDRAAWEAVPPQAQGPWYAARLREGLAACAAGGLRLPLRELEAGLEAFLAGGCVNVWVHRQRTFRARKLVATLGCELTRERFTLTLTLAQQGRVLLREAILTTDPDEHAFAYRFQDVRLEDGALVVTSKTRQPLWRRPLAALLRTP